MGQHQPGAGRREAKAAASLHHPNIGTIFEINEDDGQPFIAMEYINGVTIREMLDRLLQTRDALGSRAEVEAYELSAAIELAWLEDGDHSFKPRVRSGRTLDQNLGEALDAIDGFLGDL